MGELVLVTGATGFVASHAIDQLLRKGYRVRGTVRCLDNEEKLKPIRKLGQDHNETTDNPNLELLEADLSKPAGWEVAVVGCQYVLHIACANFKKLTPTEADKVAVDGTLNVLRACAKSDVKRVVLTGTVGNITYGNAKPPKGREQFNEEDWVDPKNPDAAMMRSKNLAERTAWDFMNGKVGTEKAKNVDLGFDLVVLHPGLVIGPLLTQHISCSVQLLQAILKRELMLLPRISFAISDVRDVAHAHIAAMTSPEVSGKRVIVADNNPMWLADIAKVLNKDFKRMDFCVPETNAPYPLLWLVARFITDVKQTLPLIGCEPKYDTSRMVKELGVKCRDPKETILDTAYSLFETGNVPKPVKYSPRGEGTEVE